MCIRDRFGGACTGTEVGYQPWNEWYRQQSDFWASKFFTVDKGWIARPTPLTKVALRRCPDYDDAFLSNQFGNGQIHSMIEVNAMRRFGDRDMSIKMGAIGGGH